MFEGIVRDLRYGLRVMLKSPSFTFLAIFALALGIGSVTTMVSVINGALWKGLPFEEPREIVWLERYNQNRDEWDRAIPYSVLEYIKEHQTSYESIAGYFGGTVNIVNGDNPVRYHGSRISAEFLDLVGVQPLPAGAPFTQEHDQVGAPPVVLLSHGAWQSQFGGSNDAIGKSVRINGKLGTVIGVMPKGFAFPSRDNVWIPLRSSLDWNDPEAANQYSLNVVARLKDGVTRDQAQAELVTLLQQVAKADPERNENYTSGAVRPFVEANTQGVARMMTIMTVMAFCVLFIACANVANLLLARSTQRTKEFAIRSSLGASRVRLLAQLLTESVMIAALGGLIGTGLAHWASQYLMTYAEAVNMPFWFDFSIEWRVLAMVILITATTGILSGIIPALRASRASVNDLLKDDTRTGTSMGMKLFSRSLVILQVSTSCIPLVLAFFMMKSLDNIVHTEMNFRDDGVLTARMGLFEGDYPKPEDRFQFFTTLKRNLENRPEIDSAALYGRYRWSTVGLDWARVMTQSLEQTEFEDLPLTTNEYISWDYFETMGAPLLGGRSFTPIDSEPNAAPVAIINEALAETLFPEGDPVGKQFRRAYWPNEIAQAAARGVELEDQQWITVVGVAPNMAAMGVGNHNGSEERHFFRPLPPGDARTFMTIAVSGGANPLNLTQVLREEVGKLDANLPLYSVGTPASLIAEDMTQNYLVTNIFRVLAGLAAILASIGIYGVVSFSVNQRTQEFGIRSALGAIPRNILQMVMQGGFAQLTIGIVLGMILSFIATRFTRNFLFDVSNNDWRIYTSVAVLFTLVALVAIFFPARRAARVHPAQALRHD